MTFAATSWLETAKIAVAGKDHMSQVTWPGLVRTTGAAPGATAVDLGPSRGSARPALRRRRQAEGVVQRMQVARVAVDLAALA
jgi:hypothetical protein